MSEKETGLRASNTVKTLEPTEVGVIHDPYSGTTTYTNFVEPASTPEPPAVEDKFAGDADIWKTGFKTPPDLQKAVANVEQKEIVYSPKTAAPAENKFSSTIAPIPEAPVVLMTPLEVSRILTRMLDRIETLETDLSTLQDRITRYNVRAAHRIL